MSKVVYESVLILFTSTIAFAAAFLSVALLLLWPHHSFLGINVKLAFLFCLSCILIACFGLVGTLIGSFRCLYFYASLVGMLPFGYILIRLVSNNPHTEITTADFYLVLLLLMLLSQILIALLYANDLRKTYELNRGINYKMCVGEEVGSEIHLCESMEDISNKEEELKD